MKVISLILTLGTATSALPNMFLTEHQTNHSMYQALPYTMAAVMGTLLLGLHHTCYAKVDHSLSKLKRLNEFHKNLSQGYCPCCMEENIHVVTLHPAQDGSEGKCTNCVNCLVGWYKSSKIPLNAWGQKTHFTCPCCRAQIKNTPLVKEAISLFGV